MPAAFQPLHERYQDWGDVHFEAIALANSNGRQDIVVRRFDECSSLLELCEKLKQGV